MNFRVVENERQVLPLLGSVGLLHSTIVWDGGWPGLLGPAPTCPIILHPLGNHPPLGFAHRFSTTTRAWNRHTIVGACKFLKLHDDGRKLIALGAKFLKHLIQIHKLVLANKDSIYQVLKSCWRKGLANGVARTSLGACQSPTASKVRSHVAIYTGRAGRTQAPDALLAVIRLGHR